ncbi:MAG: hypothetical protein PHC31_01045 [Clostridia bacterium]|nr:hypothetical protein [Clostridia bacterium]MDD3970480.1 hypothetical protein [Clostridia bacterium]
MKKVTREQLVNAANELNDEFGLEPAIKTNKRVEDEVIEEGILKASEMYDPDNDELTPETIAVMSALKGKLPEEEQTPSTPEKDAEAETEEAPELTKAQIEMLAELKVTKKMVDLVEMLEDEMFDDVRDELTKENNPIKLKGAMKRHITGEVAPPPAEKSAKPAKPAKKASKSAKGMGVIATIIDCIETAGKKGVSKEDILQVLIADFPDRDEKSMKNTINVQVPGRITKEKFPVTTLENGNYRIIGKAE